MHDDAMTPDDPGFADIARRLEAFGDLRLTPTAETAARMRAEVMSVANRRLSRPLGPDSEPAVRPATTSFVMARRSPAHGFGWHRPFAVVVAAALALGAVTGATDAARAGGPLYEPRIWAETLTLPSSGVARATAEVARIEARLVEARAAVAAGDAVGAVAALVAYADIVGEATSASDGDPATSDVIEVGVGRQLALLTKLAGVVPVQARAAIEHAMASSTNALDHLGADAPAGSNGQGAGGGAGPAMSGGGNGSGAGNGPPDDRGDGSDKAARSPKQSSEPGTGQQGPKVEPNDKDKGNHAASPKPNAAPTPNVAPTPKAPPSSSKP
ncbi:MAG: hypothetical protein H0T59_05980 [Chloroflexi bacterium]|nr:hypothetical protein [Chloroflexota bacterium]